MLMVLMMAMGSFAALGHAGAGGPSGRTADSDNDFAHATSITSGVTVSDSVNDTDDVHDFYKIDLFSGQALKANLTYTDPNNTMVVDLYDSNQNLVGEGYQGFPYIGDSVLAITNGTYYIDVWVYIGADNYDLTVTVYTPPTLVPGNTVPVHLDQASAETRYYYRIWLNGNVSDMNEGAWINITGDTQGSLAFVQFMDILNFFSSETYNYSVGNGLQESVSLAASYSGWYYLHIGAYSGAATWTFTTTKFTVPCGGDDDFANATKTKHNAAPTDNVDQGWDHYDWYNYHVFAGDTCRIKVDKLSGTDLFNLSVYDKNFNFLGSAINFDPQTGNSIASATVNLPAAGSDMNYHVYVSAYVARVNSPQPHAVDATAVIPYKITFNSTNHAPFPLSSIPDVIMNENDIASINMASYFKDPDADALAYSVTGQDANLKAAFNSTSGNIDIIPAAHWYGAEILTVSADDLFGGVSSLTVNVTVNSVNDIPFVKKPIGEIKMFQGGTDTSIDLSKVFWDYDVPFGDALNYSVSDNGSVQVGIDPSGKITLTDPVEFYGVQYMNFTATDSDSTSAVALAKITVTHVNQPPRVKTRPGPVTVNERQTASLDMSNTFSDLDGDPITLIPTGMTKIMVSIDPTTLNVSFKAPETPYTFSEDIKFTAQDDKGFGDNFVIVHVTDLAMNDPPYFKSVSPDGAVTMTETGLAEFSITALDVDSPELNYTWYLDGKDLDVADNTYDYQTTYDSAGNHQLKVVVDDGELTATHTWNITVLNKNRDPTNVKITSPKTGEPFMQYTEVGFDGSATDPDKDPLTYSWQDGNKEIGTDPSITTTGLKPGSHTIVLEVSDGNSSVRSKAVTITITPNSPPQIGALVPGVGLRFQKGHKIDFSVSATDAEGDPMTYEWSESGQVLSTQPTFTTSSLKEGTHIIQVSVSDGFSYTNRTLTVEVYTPASASSGFDGRTLAMIGGAVAVIAILAVVALMMMRKRKPSGTAAAPAPAYPAEPPMAMPVQPAGEPSPPYYGAPSEYQGQTDYSAGAPPSAEPVAEYSSENYSAEAGVSDQQPGVAAQQPSWASAPPAPKPVTGEPPSEEPPAQ